MKLNKNAKLYHLDYLIWVVSKTGAHRLISVYEVLCKKEEQKPRLIYAQILGKTIFTTEILSRKKGT